MRRPRGRSRTVRFPGARRAEVGARLVHVPDVILPCLNEAPALPWVLGRMPVGYRAVVVDNGSVDGSPAVARAHGVQVVHAAERGYGAACHAGLEACDPADGLVCFLDADGTLDPAELPALVEPLLAGRADLVLGRRVPTERAAWSPHSRAGNAALAAILRRRFRVALRDLGPMRVASAQRLRALGVVDRRFGYPLETVGRARAAGWRLAEVPVSYRPRIAGTTSKVTGTVGGTARTVWDMSRTLRALSEAGQ